MLELKVLLYDTRKGRLLHFFLSLVFNALVENKQLRIIIIDSLTDIKHIWVVLIHLVSYKQAFVLYDG